MFPKKVGRVSCTEEWERFHVNVSGISCLGGGIVHVSARVGPVRVETVSLGVCGGYPARVGTVPRECVGGALLGLGQSPCKCVGGVL